MTPRTAVVVTVLLVLVAASVDAVNIRHLQNMKLIRSDAPAQNQKDLNRRMQQLRPKEDPKAAKVESRDKAEQASGAFGGLKNEQTTKSPSQAANTATQATGQRMQTQPQHRVTASEVDDVVFKASDPKQPIDTKGWARLRTIIAALVRDLRTEQEASAINHKKQMAKCDLDIGNLNASIARYEKKIQVAKETIDQSTEDVRQLQQSIESLNKIVGPRAREVADSERQLAQGEDERTKDKQVNDQKLADAKAVIEAIQSIYDKLGDAQAKDSSNSTKTATKDASGAAHREVKASDVRFQETLLHLRTTIKDPKVQGMLEAASNAFTGDGKGLRDVAGMRQLLFLLISESKQYRTTVSKREQNSALIWATRKLQIKEQINIWKADLDERTTQRQARLKRLEDAKYNIQEAKETLAHLPTEVKELKKQQTIWIADCKDNKMFYQQERTDREVQISTLNSIDRLQKLKSDRPSMDLLNTATQNLVVPNYFVTTYGKRCSRVCRSGKACGQYCIPKIDKCLAKGDPKTDWSACNIDEVMELPPAKAAGAVAQGSGSPVDGGVDPVLKAKEEAARKLKQANNTSNSTKDSDDDDDDDKKGNEKRKSPENKSSNSTNNKTETNTTSTKVNTTTSTKSQTSALLETWSRLQVASDMVDGANSQEAHDDDDFEKFESLYHSGADHSDEEDDDLRDHEEDRHDLNEAGDSVDNMVHELYAQLGRAEVGQAEDHPNELNDLDLQEHDDLADETIFDGDDADSTMMQSFFF